jgi:hypothetical protein
MKEFPSLFSVSADISQVSQSTQVRKILDSAVDNIAGNQIHYDLWYHGSVWAFAELVECGLTITNPVVAKTADYITRHSQLASGGFTMNWAPPSEAAGWTGNILFYLLAAGFQGEAIHRAATWLAQLQRSDGGWSHAPISGVKDALSLSLFRKSGKIRVQNGESSLLSTVSCGRALTLYTSRFGNCPCDISKAADFVLTKKRLLRKRQHGGELYLSNSRFHSLSYPVLCQQDLLSSLLFVAEAGKLGDERASEPFNIVMRKRLSDGKFCGESRESGTLHAKYGWKTRKPDKWITLQCLRLMKYINS